MKRIKLFGSATLVLMLAVTPVLAGSSAGTLFGSLTTATTVGMGHGAFQGGVGIADLTTVYGAYRYGFSNYTQGRIKLGLADDQNINTKLIFGADFLYQFWDVKQGTAESKKPFDMGFQGFFEYGDFDYVSLLEIGGAVVGSYPFLMSNGHTLTPYGRVDIRMEKSNYDVSIPGLDDTNLEFGINAGVHYQFTKDIGGYGELQLDGNDGIFLGIDFLTM